MSKEADLAKLDEVYDGMLRKYHGIENRKEPPPIFLMDGEEHYLNALSGCCNVFGKQCSCGGFMHYQPVYGGYYYKCEKCLREE